MNAGDFADQARPYSLTNIGEVRRPAAVLIDGKSETTLLRECDEFAAVIEVLDEGLLRQHMFARFQPTPHEVEAGVRMGGEIEDAQVRIAQHGIEIVRNARDWEMDAAAHPGALEIARADDDHVQAMTRIGVEMRRADATRADQRDGDATVARHRRTVRKVGRFDLRCSLGDQRVVVGRRAIGLFQFCPGHGSRANVRRSRAESAAVSTIR